MRRRVIWTLSVALPGLLATAAGAATKQQPSQEPIQEPSQEPIRELQPSQKAQPPIDMPQQRPQSGMPQEQMASDAAATELEQAQAASTKGDTGKAAEHLSNAANELRREASSIEGQDKETLERAAADLEVSAEAAKKEEGKLTKESNTSIARVEHDLADYRVGKAKESWADKAAEKTGHELRAATHHLTNATKWTGTKVERGTRDVVGGATRVSGKLIEGAGYVPKEVGKAIQDVGTEVDKLGKKIMPAR